MSTHDNDPAYQDNQSSLEPEYYRIHISPDVQYILAHGLHEWYIHILNESRIAMYKDMRESIDILLED